MRSSVSTASTITGSPIELISFISLWCRAPPRPRHAPPRRSAGARDEAGPAVGTDRPVAPELVGRAGLEADELRDDDRLAAAPSADGSRARAGAGRQNVALQCRNHVWFVVIGARSRKSCGASDW